MNSDRKSRLPSLIGFLLLMFTMVLYWPALDCEFINYDDHQYVAGNSHVRAGLTLETCRWAFNIGYACNWHPLTWLSHMGDCQFFGVNPRGHHVTNLVLHLANTLLLFGVWRRMTGALWPSALVGALFAFHPLHVESVAWVAERKDLLSTCFFLLTLWAYTRYVEQSKVQSPRPKVWYVLALLFFALGLMSKPMLVTLPFVLLLLDYWPLDRNAECGPRSAEGETGGGPGPARGWGWLVAEKIPFLVLSLGSCVITLVAQKRGGAVVPIEVIALDVRCWNALVSYLRYAGKLVWPCDLAVIYPYVYQWPVWVTGAAVAFLPAVSVLAFMWRRRAPYFPVGWFWFVGTLVPVIGLVQVGEQAMADRYTYIPAIGFFLVVGWAFSQAAARWPCARVASLGAALLALAVCAATTRLQLRYWRDGVSLFEHALAVTTNNAVAHATLGLALMDKDKLPEAVAQYETALQISPDYSLAHNNLGVALARMARFDEAIAHYQTALRLNPRDAEAHFNLANALNPGYLDTYGLGDASPPRRVDAPKGREHYQAALAIFPKYVNAHVNWGNLELTEGNLEAALAHYHDAIRIDPLSALAHFNLGNALAKMGRTNEARAAYARAVAIEPEDYQARFRLANLLVSAGEFEQAIPHYQQVLRLKPDHFVACSNLGSALAKVGRYEEAARCFAEAIRLQPDYPDAHANLGRFRALEGNLDTAVKEYAEALRLQPENPRLHHEAALLLVRQDRMNDALAHFSAVAKLNPSDPGAHYDLALALAKLGRSEEAVAPLREALRLKADWIQPINNLAWILATHDKAEVRNGAEAVRLAIRACVLTGYKDATVLGTLDAAYAEAGRYADAIETAQQTCELALAVGKTALADKARARLKLYQAGQPFHEVRPSQPQ